MKLKIKREALLRPLQQVLGVVERRQTMPILANVLVEGAKGVIRLTATDLEVELRTSVAEGVIEEGSTTIPGRKLGDICRSLPEGADIEISSKGSEAVVIRSGRSRFTLATLPAEDFPSVEGGVKGSVVTLPQGELKGVLEGTAFAMAQQDVRYYLNGLLLELSKGRIRAVATDGHRLALAERAMETGVESPTQVIVPRKGVMELTRLLEGGEEPATVTVGTNHLRVEFGAVGFTSKLIDGRFPDYMRVIPQGGDKRVVVDRETLKAALGRTAILSNEKYRGVRFELAAGLIRMQAHNPEQEAAEEELEVEYGGEGLEIGFNANYMLDALAALRADQAVLTLTDANSSCLVEGREDSSSRYVVMPMRL